MTVRERLSEAQTRARRAGSDATPWDARTLLAHAVGHGKPLALDPREDIPAETASRFRALWERRLSGVPVQHLVGEWDFFGRTFFVDSRALIPRPETELLVETALTEAPDALRALDLGTGSGILAVTWLLERPGARAVAVDASTEALALAGANARRHGVIARLKLVSSDWTSAVSPLQLFDLAISNPPYLLLSERAGLSPTVRDHDPEAALFGGEDGLDDIRILLDDVARYLPAGAPFLFEIGAGQSSDVRREVADRPAWRLDRIVPDLAGIPRVAVARRT
ncbi:MAG: peptide chain release factor N(5)-glutamine methyltransferase [Acidobacteriota bacterium]